MKILEIYLNELFGFGQIDAWKLLDTVEIPIQKKFNYVMNINNNVCKKEKDESKTKGYLCIYYEFLKISEEHLSKTKELFPKCKGDKKCEKIIKMYIIKASKGLSDTKQNIRLIKSGKPTTIGSY